MNGGSDRTYIIPLVNWDIKLRPNMSRHLLRRLCHPVASSFYAFRIHGTERSSITEPESPPSGRRCAISDLALTREFHGHSSLGLLLFLDYAAALLSESCNPTPSTSFSRHLHHTKSPPFLPFHPMTTATNAAWRGLKIASLDAPQVRADPLRIRIGMGGATAIKDV